MPDNVTTVTGNVTRDPELRFSNSGGAMASFGVAVNTRKLENGEWVEGDSHFFDVQTFGTLAENVCESVEKGTRVVVTGRLQQRTWEKDGEKKSKIEIVADEVAPSLRWATAKVERTKRA